MSRVLSVQLCFIFRINLNYRTKDLRKTANQTLEWMHFGHETVIWNLLPTTPSTNHLAFFIKLLEKHYLLIQHYPHFTSLNSRCFNCNSAFITMTSKEQQAVYTVCPETAVEVMQKRGKFRLAWKQNAEVIREQKRGNTEISGVRTENNSAFFINSSLAIHKWPSSAWQCQPPQYCKSKFLINT